MSAAPEFIPSRKLNSSWGIAALIVLLTVLAYSNSFHGPFVFDDSASIETNPTIRDLGDAKKLLSPPGEGVTVTGRPLLNVSLALNYAVSGTKVEGYHVTNLAIHLLSALLLFGILWRTMLSEPLQSEFGEAALPLAGVVALLWSLHPVQTESVTYIIQRAESLAGMFYLLVFYAFIRGATENSGRWFGVAISAGFLGVATKEIVVTAPLLLVVYDRIFLAGTWREVWRQRSLVHLGIASCWGLQGALLATAGLDRGGTMGHFTVESPLSFAFSQFAAVAHYLRLCLWPRPLVFDYGFPSPASFDKVWPEVLLIFLVTGATIWALRKRPVIGFAGLWFFVVLAPSTLVPGTMQGMAEHRLYLSLAAVVALMGLLAYRWQGIRALAVLAIVGLVLGGLTFQRNRDYRTRTYLWTDTVYKRPENARAQDNLGRALVQEKRLAEATPFFAEAVRLKPDFAPAHRNFARALAEQGEISRALAQLEIAVRLEPENGDFHHYLGDVLLRAGKPEAAAEHYALALRTRPDFAEEQEVSFGTALMEGRNPSAAVTFFEGVLKRRPRSPVALNNLGQALVKVGRPREAVGFHFKAWEIKPGDAETTFFLGYAFLAAGDLNEAVTAFHNAIKLDGRMAEAHSNLGVALFRLGRTRDAESEFRAALQIDPRSTAAAENLAKLQGR